MVAGAWWCVCCQGKVNEHTSWRASIPVRTSIMHRARPSVWCVFRSVLTKTYFMLPEDDGVLEKAEGTKIEWKAGELVLVAGVGWGRELCA